MLENDLTILLFAIFRATHAIHLILFAWDLYCEIHRNNFASRVSFRCECDMDLPCFQNFPSADNVATRDRFLMKMLYENLNPAATLLPNENQWRDQTQSNPTTNWCQGDSRRAQKRTHIHLLQIIPR